MQLKSFKVEVAILGMGSMSIMCIMMDVSIYFIKVKILYLYSSLCLLDGRCVQLENCLNDLYVHLICTVSQWLSELFAVNRRLDEWVEMDRLDLSNKLEDPHCKIKDMSIMMTDLSDGTDRKITRNQKRKHDEINHVQKVGSLCENV